MSRSHGFADDAYLPARIVRHGASGVTDWSECIAQVAPQIVRIQTADRSGTGFINHGSDGGARFIATARHVIESFPRH